MVDLSPIYEGTEILATSALGTKQTEMSVLCSRCFLYGLITRRCTG